MKTPRTLTIVIACFNEEDNLCLTYQGLLNALESADFGPDHYEIIIVDDGSTDRTAAIADAIAADNPHVRLVHNPGNKGYGHSLYIGLNSGRMTYLAVIPGDNEIHPESITDILRAIGSADIVTGFPLNREVRPRFRRFLSGSFVILLNLLFGCSLEYYNGPNVYKMGQVISMDIDTSSFAFNAIILIRLIREGRSVKQIGMRLAGRSSSRTSALKIKNITAVIRDIAQLFFRLRLGHKQRCLDKIKEGHP